MRMSNSSTQNCPSFSRRCADAIRISRSLSRLHGVFALLMSATASAPLLPHASSSWPPTSRHLPGHAPQQIEQKWSLARRACRPSDRRRAHHRQPATCTRWSRGRAPIASLEAARQQIPSPGRATQCCSWPAGRARQRGTRRTGHEHNGPTGQRVVGELCNVFRRSRSRRRVWAVRFCGPYCGLA